MNIQEIKINKYPVCIFTDAHCNIKNIKELQRLYPNCLLLSLGDIVQLFSKPGEKFNHYILDFFIKEKIPNLMGNHCQHILGCGIGDSFTKIMPKYDEGSSFVDADIYDLTQQHIDFLRKLPIGFKLILPNGKYYLCYHNEPKDLWSHKDYLNANQFQDAYPIKNDCLGVIHGHLHSNFIHEYQGLVTKRIGIGQLCNSNHHTGENNGKNYGLLTENGIEFKKI